MKKGTEDRTHSFIGVVFWHRTAVMVMRTTDGCAGVGNDWY